MKRWSIRVCFLLAIVALILIIAFAHIGAWLLITWPEALFFGGALLILTIIIWVMSGFINDDTRWSI